MSDYIIHEAKDCPDCDSEGRQPMGSGEVINKICSTCGGDGVLWRDIPLEETQVVKDLKARVHNLENQV